MQLSDKDYLLNQLPNQVDYPWLMRLMMAWVESEALPFKMGVLATVDEQGFAQSRTIAIREINEQGLLFFTQQGSAKVAQLSANPCVSFTFLLPNTQRQVTILGQVRPMGEKDNLKYWETYNLERRLRFLVYGTKSGQLIKKQQALDDELAALREQFKDSLPKKPQEYLGYLIVPEVIKFYQLNEHRLSDSISAALANNIWTLQRFVP